MRPSRLVRDGRTGARRATPRSGTTTSITCCTSRRPARAQGYYADYVGDTDKLGRALAEGFAFQGEMMPYRGSAARRAERRAAADGLRGLHPEPRPDRQPRLRRPAARVRAARGGARGRGRLSAAAADPDAVHGRGMGRRRSRSRSSAISRASSPRRCATAGARSSRASRNSSDPATRERIPDPLAEATFRSAKLDWDDVDRRAGHADARLVPRAAGASGARASCPLAAAIGTRRAATRCVGDAQAVERDAGRTERAALTLVLAANLKARARRPSFVPAGPSGALSVGSEGAGVGRRQLGRRGAVALDVCDRG